METRKPTRQRDTEDHRPEGITSPVEGFNERGRKAVQDRELHDAVELFTNKSVAVRNEALHALPDAPGLREKAYHIKQETMANLDGYLEQMSEAVEARGGNVFFASDGEDVVRYVGELARRRGAKIVTKSKSMATEEIELNRRLEEDYADLDLEIVETDLGEWIAQLSGDTPSHIIGPILHLNLRQITEILSEAAGKELPPDVEALTRFARERLREKFLAADIGITGANFGVAETGTIATVTNEGNGRLVATVPPVHVVVMGIEKLIPRFEDLSTFVQLLARSATGQKLSVYTNFVTGPRAEGELDGAEEFHLILLDNEPLHDTRLVDDPVTPVHDASIPNLLAAGGLGDVATLSVRELRDPERVRETLDAHRCVVADATEDAHLKLLVEAVPDPADVLWAGSAGLVVALGNAYPGPETETSLADHPGSGSRALTVVGSTNPTVRGQLHRLDEKTAAVSVPLSSDKLVDGGGAVESALGMCREALEKGSSVALYSTDEEILAGETGRIVEALAEVVVGLSEDGLFEALVLTGGDTAVHVARSLGARGILLDGEIEPGVPLGTLIGDNPYRVVTKAGGFGTSETLIHAQDVLTGKDPNLE